MRHAGCFAGERTCATQARAAKSRNREGIVDEQKEQDRIRRRAYEIWEREGSPDGRAEEFWQQAQASIEAEDGPDQSGREAEAHGDATIK
nr:MULTISPECIES: DUF2934 domain-containing protein [unclassified Caballeronia]